MNCGESNCQPRPEDVAAESQAVRYVPYQLCPKCEGQGKVERPPWVNGNVRTWTDCVGSHTCDVCNGSKIIPMCVLPPEPVAVQQDAASYFVQTPQDMRCGKCGAVNECKMVTRDHPSLSNYKEIYTHCIRCGHERQDGTLSFYQSFSMGAMRSATATEWPAVDVF